jgi:hypothetical protein
MPWELLARYDGRIRVGTSCGLFQPAIQQFAEKLWNCHRGERFSRRGNLEVIDFVKTEIASLRSQRQRKDFFSDLLGFFDSSASLSNMHSARRPLLL